jgi:hypothetical protein
MLFILLMCYDIKVDKKEILEFTSMTKHPADILIEKFPLAFSGSQEEEDEQEGKEEDEQEGKEEELRPTMFP